MQRKNLKVRIRAGTNCNEVEQLEVLQRKRKQLAKLQRIHRVLEEREQVRCQRVLRTGSS
jgi:hypothetical protein